MLFTYVIIAVYLLLIVGIGLYFRKDNKDSTSFLRANGTLPWFWVGASAYVSQFSASSFTILAAEAYRNGFNVLIPYLGNVVAFLFAGLFFASKLKQLNVNAPTDAIAMRFGRKNANIFAALVIPNLLIYPAIWLSGLSVFISASLNIPVKSLIIIVGGITLLVSILGGAWAVISSDFIQSIIITIISIACAIFAYVKFREVGGVLHAMPISTSLMPSSASNAFLYGLWVFYMIIQKTLHTNNLNNLQRFNAVDSSMSAKKASFLAMGIYIFGMFIWFVPAWFMSTQNISLEGMYPNISRPDQAAYLAFVQQYMPVGILGLIIVSLFSATMSSIDSSLNWCSGYVLGMFKKQGRGGEIFLGRSITAFFGILIIVFTLIIDQMWKTSFFNFTYTLIGKFYIPLIIPVFLAYWIKKVPDWSFIPSILLGLGVSFLFGFLEKQGLYHTLLSGVFNVQDPGSKDIFHIRLFMIFMVQIIAVGAYFAVVRLFYKVEEMSQERLNAINEFYTRLHTPILRDPQIQAELAPKFRNIHFIAICTVLILLEITLLSAYTLMLAMLAVGTIVACYMCKRLYVKIG